ncbi:MAG: response regulator transcription factor [Actinomycetota bacterium]|nr:response regulator transcription factor [Actinomycetota bacterium]
MKKTHEKMHVLIVDDHDAVRQALGMLLNLEKDIRVVGDAKDGEEAVERAEKLSPDVIVMDLALPRMDGLEAARIIKTNDPKVKIIVLSVHDEGANAKRAIEAGVERWISKNLSPDKLIEAIREIGH